MLDEYINSLQNDIINSTCELIKIPSVSTTKISGDKPFGDGPFKALEYILNLGKSLGFRTKNIDGYCGYIEFGEGTELVGIIGHLDVVPEGENWTYPPFSATISDGKIYGRGAIDDKGPVIASLYAMKAVMDNCKINKRVRLILGLDEEKEWRCINYYKEHEEHPSIGFSPDADFPCIYAEKALLSTFLTQNYSCQNSCIKIKSIDCNNNAINVVPKFCKMILEIDNNFINISDLKNKFDKQVYENKFNISVNITNENTIEIVSQGVSAHAAHPDLGKNAISQLLIIIHNVFELYNVNIELIDFMYKYINLEFTGEKLGINYVDESGGLTLNVAQFTLDNNILSIGMNLRIPVTLPIDNVKNTFKQLVNSSNIKVNFGGEKEALYIPKDNPLVVTLCDIFNKKTGLNAMPIAIGGATYARAFNNCISYGANMPGHIDLCHQVDEYIEIDNLITSSKIYAEAIYELAK